MLELFLNITNSWLKKRLDIYNKQSLEIFRTLLLVGIRFTIYYYASFIVYIVAS